MIWFGNIQFIVLLSVIDHTCRICYSFRVPILLLKAKNNHVFLKEHTFSGLPNVFLYLENACTRDKPKVSQVFRLNNLQLYLLWFSISYTHYLKWLINRILAPSSKTVPSCCINRKELTSCISKIKERLYIIIFWDVVVPSSYVLFHVSWLTPLHFFWNKLTVLLLTSITILYQQCLPSKWL